MPDIFEFQALFQAFALKFPSFTVFTKIILVPNCKVSIINRIRGFYDETILEHFKITAKNSPDTILFEGNAGYCMFSDELYLTESFCRKDK